jgi:hypothetical protein
LSFNCNGAKYGSDDKCEPAISIKLCYPTHARRLHGVFGLLYWLGRLTRSAREGR